MTKKRLVSLTKEAVGFNKKKLQKEMFISYKTNVNPNFIPKLANIFAYFSQY